MSADKDNVLHIDFRRGRVADEDSTDELDVSRTDDAAGEPDEETDDGADHDFVALGGATEKLVVFEEMLEHGIVLLTFDTRVKGVEVPAAFRGTPQLHLSFSMRFRIDDFEVDEDGVRGTLSFDDGPFRCIVPWEAVYGMSSEAMPRRVTFPRSFPPELLAMLPALADLDDDDDE
jgi:hypothetical protein